MFQINFFLCFQIILCIDVKNNFLKKYYFNIFLNKIYFKNNLFTILKNLYSIKRGKQYFLSCLQEHSKMTLEIALANTSQAMQGKVGDL